MDKCNELTIDELNLVSGGKDPSIGIGYGTNGDGTKVITWGDSQGVYTMTEGKAGYTWTPR